MPLNDSICRKVSCCNAEGVEFSPFIYNVVNGQTYENAEFTLVVPCPEGYDCTAPSVTVILPPGTVRFTPSTLNQNNPPPSGGGDPWNPEPGSYTFTCGDQTLTITVGEEGFTQAQIDAIINFQATCIATQTGNAELEPVPIFTPSGAPGIRLWNAEQSCTETCPEGSTGDPQTVTIPARTNSVVIAASSTPLQRYLAQQTLNNAAMAQACAAAEAALICSCGDYSCAVANSFDADFSQGCLYAPNSGLVYVQQDSEDILVVNPDTLATVATISLPAGERPSCLGYHPTSEKLYVGSVNSGLDQTWLHTVNPLTNTITASQLLDVAVSLRIFAADTTNDQLFLLAGSPFRLWFMDVTVGVPVAVLSGVSGTNGLGMAYYELDDALFIADSTDLEVYDAVTLGLMSSYTPANFPVNLAVCPDTNELYSGDHTGQQIEVWDLQAPLATVTTANFNAPAINSTVTIFVDDEDGMYVGRNFEINGTEWYLESVDNPGEITAKNLSVVMGTLITTGAAVTWIGTGFVNSIAIGGSPSGGVLFDDVHRKIVVSSYLDPGPQRFIVIEPETQTITCNLELSGVLGSHSGGMSHNAGFAANCRTFVSDSGSLFVEQDKVRVIS